MKRYCKLVAQWYLPVVGFISFVLIWISDFRTNMIIGNLIFFGNAVVIAMWFRNILNGLPAFYFVSRTDPDDDDIEVMEKLMLSVAGVAILAQIYLALQVL